ncbi:MAG: M20/M25/M40 family metallo-hydrolase, partial [Ignavibacteriae bacterium]|nr:M20/M25/M40 family metallo-hydrolase [Ignavibacteriota bacterium]
VKFLASDELEGRGTGSAGNKKAAEYIVEQFTAFGLKPAGPGGSWYQPFEFVSAVQLGKNNSLSIAPMIGPKRPLLVDKDFRPLGFSSNASVKGSAVFAGYGISAPEKNYDDYANLDVTGKVVIALRYGPDGNDMHSEYYKFTSFRNKARYARDKGAAALILVDPLDDDLVKLSYDQSFATSGIPCLTMHRNLLERILEPLNRDLNQIRDSIKSSRKPVAIDLPELTVDLSTEIIKVMGTTANVIGKIDGDDEKLKNEHLIIGAHFDHLGFGGPGSGSLQPDVHEIHNGADDNASGSAGLLEVAQRFGTSTDKPRRTILFLAFSGEEMGTLGSQYYTNNPVMPLNTSMAMLNMDMIGRMKDNSITVSGVGTAALWNDLVKKANAETDTLTIKTVADGFGPSDHASFYTKDIPVLFFFTGNHPDYHKPSDDWDKINVSDEARVVRYVYRIANELQQVAEKPAFIKTQTTASMGGGDGRGFTVTLGVVPDYGATVEGMRIDGTRAGGPAEKAGLKAGDVITKLAKKKVMNIYDYMGVLTELKTGDVVEIEVLRDGKSMVFSATMQKR